MTRKSTRESIVCSVLIMSNLLRTIIEIVRHTFYPKKDKKYFFFRKESNRTKSPIFYVW